MITGSMMLWRRSSGVSWLGWNGWRVCQVLEAASRCNVCRTQFSVYMTPNIVRLEYGMLLFGVLFGMHGPVDVVGTLCVMHCMIHT